MAKAPWLHIKSGALKRGAHTSNFMDLTIQPAPRVGPLRALVTPNSPHLIAAAEFCLAYRRSHAARLLEHSQNGFLDCHSWMVR